MKKMIYLDDKDKKLVIGVTILAFVGVIAFSIFMGCTGEAADRAKDETGRIIDTTDEADAAGSVSVAMMSNPCNQAVINPTLIPILRPGHMIPRPLFESACSYGCA